MKRRVALFLATMLLIVALFFGGTPAALAGTYADKVLALSPVSYWKLDESSGTTAIDSSGNGYNGTYYGPTLNSLAGPGSSMGNAPLFDSINDYINIYSSGFASALNTDEGSATAWVWLDSTAGSYGGVFDAGNSTTQKIAIARAVVGIDRGIQANITSGTLPAYNAWYPVGISWSKSANQFKLYINGSLADTGAWGGVSGGVTQASIGFLISYNNWYWKGYLGHIAFFNSVLGTNDFATLADYNPPPTPTPTIATATITPRSPQLILTLANGNQFEIDYSITAGDIAQFIPGLLLIAFLVFLIILRLVRR